MKNSPNILWICSEHQRYDTISALGNEHIRTPGLDRLARAGTAFTHAFCQHTVCAPSRASFLTGMYPASTGVRQNGQSLASGSLLISAELARAGYDCGLVGKLHVSAAAGGSERVLNDGYRFRRWSHGSTAKHGGDWLKWLAERGKTFEQLYSGNEVFRCREVREEECHQTAWCFNEAINFLEEKREGPWFLSVNPFAAHDPFDVVPEFYARYDLDSLPPPAWRDGELENKPEIQRNLYRLEQFRGETAESELHLKQQKAGYYANIEHMDSHLGRLLDRLEASGESANTLVIFNSDHGDMLGDHGLFAKGCFFYDPVIRVPLILSWPGVLPEGAVSGELTELVDIVPTIRELLGLPDVPGTQGKSLVPAARGAEDEHRPGVYCEYLQTPVGGGGFSGNNVYASLWRSKDYKVAVYHGLACGELYDLKKDPHEFNNLWDEPGYERLRFELLRECFDRRVFTMKHMPLREAPY